MMVDKSYHCPSGVIHMPYVCPDPVTTTLVGHAVEKASATAALSGERDCKAARLRDCGWIGLADTKEAMAAAIASMTLSWYIVGFGVIGFVDADSFDERLLISMLYVGGEGSWEIRDFGCADLRQTERCFTIDAVANSRVTEAVTEIM
jgi:hypothetical protein